MNTGVEGMCVCVCVIVFVCVYIYVYIYIYYSCVCVCVCVRACVRAYVNDKKRFRVWALGPQHKKP
jgi:hypothetical protein